MNYKATFYKFLFLMIFLSATIFPQKAKWTFMVYLDADNDLEKFGVADFNEMETVGSSADVQIIVQMDRIPGYDATNGDWTDTRRFRITKDNDKQTMTSPVLQNLGEANMGNPQTLVDFVNWAKQNYPADHYCLVLWDHGGGWRNQMNFAGSLKKMDAGMNSNTGALSNATMINLGASVPALFRNPYTSGWGQRKDVCYDETDSDHLSSDEVGAALTNIGIVVDIVAYDACLMGMIENAYEIRGKASYMIGSEETEPGDGWPYDLVLSALSGNPNMTAADFSRVIVQKYGQYYAASSGTDQTQAAYDLSKVTALFTAMNNLATTLKTAKPWTHVKSSVTGANNFNKSQNIDIHHFCDLLSKSGAPTDVVNAANAVKTAVTNMVIENYAEATHGSSKGVAVYCPPSSAYDPKYANGLLKLDFPNDSQWDEFLQAYYNGNTGSTIYDPYEPNNSWQQSYGPITSGQSYKGYCTDVNDVDIFKFAAGSTFNLEVTLAVPSDLDIYLVRQEGEKYYLVDSSVSIGKINERIVKNNLTAGNYLIAVIPYEASQTAYDLKAIIGGGTGSVDAILGFDDGSPGYGLYSTRTDINEGVACYFRPPVSPAKIKGFYYYLTAVNAVPGVGKDGSFYVFGADYYGALLPDTIKYVRPGGTGWNYVDLSANNISIYGDFFAGMYWDRYNTPVIGWDTAATNGLNLIYTQTQYGTLDWQVGLGTFFIRAKVGYTNTATGVEETADLAPNTFSLGQNYPNPFNPATTIKFKLPASSDISLKIYSLLGQEIEVLKKGQMSAGEHTILWKPKNLPSGVYMYKLEAGKFSETKKLIYLK